LIRAAALLVGLALGSGCVSPTPPHEVDRLTQAAIVAAEGHLRDGNPGEAAELLGAVLAADPGNPLATALRAPLDVVGRSRALGMNRARRAPADRHLVSRALLYLPDRFVDLCDVLSFDVHLGFGLWADVHATRALQAMAGTRSIQGLGWHERRSLGTRDQAESGFTLLAIGAHASAGTLIGTSGVYGYAATLGGLHEPSDRPYQEIRDYWALGAAFTLAFVGMDFDFHPVQLADFAAGWLTVDFLNDDFAHTRSLNLPRYERELIRDLYRIEDRSY
jgi:hypothetical protein